MSHFKQSKLELKVQHNFKSYVLIVSKKINWHEEEILESIYQLNGYKCHKTVKYMHYTSHIHVKFEEEHLAQAAVVFFKNLSTDLTAVLVDEMLKDWFHYEMKAKYDVPYTLTIVDIVGNPPFGLDFLKKSILESIFQNFGDPYLVPYTAAVSEPHVQVLFGSMTTALAACIAFGEWYHHKEKMDSFFHRIRINPSDKEAYLIKRSGGKPEEAFKLDYFVNFRNRIVPKSKVREIDIKNSKFSKPKNPSQLKEAGKLRQQMNAPILQTVQNNLTRYRTPILCVPVIHPPPPRSCYSQPLTPNSNHLDGDLTAGVLNFQRIDSRLTLTTVSPNDPETEIQINLQSQNLDVSLDCDIKKFSVNKVPETPVPTDITPQSPDDDIILNTAPSKETRTTSAKYFQKARRGSLRPFGRYR